MTPKTAPGGALPQEPAEQAAAPSLPGPPTSDPSQGTERSAGIHHRLRLRASARAAAQDEGPFRGTEQRASAVCSGHGRPLRWDTHQGPDFWGRSYSSNILKVGFGKLPQFCQHHPRQRPDSSALPESRQMAQTRTGGGLA